MIVKFSTTYKNVKSGYLKLARVKGLEDVRGLESSLKVYYKL